MTTKTEKIKVTVTTKEVKELEISFPYYVKDGHVLIKFFDREKGIIVTDYHFSKRIEYMDIPENWITFLPTTEEEFNAKFDEVMSFLTKKKSE